METVLTDEEFNRLLAMEKVFLTLPKLPGEQENKTFQIKSKYSFEVFSLTIQRNRVYELSKSKLNTSYSKIPIVRVEFNAPPHQNPDGKKIGRNHIHIYREGYGMSWAYDLKDFHESLFKSPEDFNTLFFDFCTFCNIMNDRDIQGVI